MSVAIITGASSGLGMEFAKQLSQLSADRAPTEYWLIARRQAEMEKLADELGKTCRVLPMDLLDEKSLLELEQILKEEQPEIGWLINSAGFGKIGSVDELSGEIQKNIVCLNCVVPVLLSKLCSPYLVKGASVFQISSVAAFIPQPFFAIYAASKSFILSFSRALAREWKDRDVKVIAVCPNPMETEFFKVAGTDEKSSKIKKIGIETPKHVVSYALWRIARDKDVSVSSFWAKLIQLGSRLFPHTWIMTIEKWLGVY